MGQALFQVWILSFLFYRLDIVGSLSIDNLMVPILVLAWFFVGDRKNLRVNHTRFRVVAYVTLVFFLLIVIDVVKEVGGGNMAALSSPVIEHLKHYGYILVPLLYISDEKILRRALTSLLAVTVVNSGLAVLGALGTAPSFVLVGESTRIPGLLRARGPMVNDGDTALLIALMSLLAWTTTRQPIKLVGNNLAVRALVLLVMFAGVVATQSRNVILTIALSFAVYYWLRMMMMGRAGGIRVLWSLLGIAGFLGAVTLMAVNADAIIAWVTDMFGVSGQGTVRDRLASYEHAAKLMADSWLIGLSPGRLLRSSVFIAKLHNMWLGLALFSGVLGVLLVFSMIVVSLIGALRLVRERYWNEYGLILASFILASLWFSPNFYLGHNAFIFWFCIGITLTAAQTYYFMPRQAASRRVGLGSGALDNVKPPRNARILRYKRTGPSSPQGRY